MKIVTVRAADLAGIVLEAPPRRRGGRPWSPLPLFDLEAPDAADVGQGDPGASGAYPP